MYVALKQENWVGGQIGNKDQSDHYYLDIHFRSY